MPSDFLSLGISLHVWPQSLPTLEATTPRNHSPYNTPLASQSPGLQNTLPESPGTICVIVVYVLFCGICIIKWILKKAEHDSIMGETIGGPANRKDDSASLEAAFTWITPSHFPTSDSGPHGSL